MNTALPVAVVIPVHRNAATLAELVARLRDALPEPWTIRLVIDACPAGSGAVAAGLAADDLRVRVTQLRTNIGQNRALTTGLTVENEAARWVCMDADLQDPPEAVPLLLAHLEAWPVDAVFAGRRGDYESTGRRTTGTLYRRSLAAMTGLPPDAGAFVAMNRVARDAVIESMRRGAPGVVVSIGAGGLRTASIPVERAVRVHGTSSWSSTARLRQAGAGLWWVARHRHRPDVPAVGHLAAPPTS